jgi:hypothetical protein
VFASTGSLPALIVAALTVSTDAVESGPIISLEQAMLTLVHPGSARWLLAYPVAAALCIPVAAGRSRGVERGEELEGAPRSIARAGFVYRLAARFLLDSFGGGFVVRTFIAYWFVYDVGLTPSSDASV